MTVELRAATPEDSKALTQLFLDARRSAMPYLPTVHSDSETEDWMQNLVIPAETVVLAEDGGTVLGFAAVKDGRLNHLYVGPAYQGRGIGSRLLAEAKSLASGPLSLFVFQRNQRARSFYETHGFVLAALRDGSDNEENEPDAIYLAREALEDPDR